MVAVDIDWPLTEKRAWFDLDLYYVYLRYILSGPETVRVCAGRGGQNHLPGRPGQADSEFGLVILYSKLPGEQADNFIN